MSEKRIHAGTNHTNYIACILIMIYMFCHQQINKIRFFGAWARNDPNISSNEIRGCLCLSESCLQMVNIPSIRLNRLRTNDFYRVSVSTCSSALHRISSNLCTFAWITYYITSINKQEETQLLTPYYRWWNHKE